MVIFVFWLVLAALVGVYAASKGRSGIGFFFLALLLSPLIGFIIALVASPLAANVEAKAIESGEFKKCPFCAEVIKSAAIVCKHCGNDVPTEASRPSTEYSASVPVPEMLTKEQFNLLRSDANEARFIYLLDRWYKEDGKTYTLQSGVPGTVHGELYKYMNRSILGVI